VSLKKQTQMQASFGILSSVYSPCSAVGGVREILRHFYSHTDPPVWMLDTGRTAKEGICTNATLGLLFAAKSFRMLWRNDLNVFLTFTTISTARFDLETHAYPP
jgi:hypothetical protein